MIFRCIQDFILQNRYLFQEIVPDDFEPAEARIYKVGLGMGYLELPQGKKNIKIIMRIMWGEKGVIFSTFL